MVTDYVAGGMFSARILAGANAAARARDHVLMIGETDGDEGVTTDLVHEFVDRQVDGLLFVTRTTSTISLPRGPGGHARRHRQLRRPRRVVPQRAARRSRRRPAGGGGDLGRSGSATASSWWARGPTSGGAGRARIAGLDERLAGQARASRRGWSAPGRSTPRTTPCSSWLAAGGRPRVVVCLNDRIAWGVYHALADIPLAVPDDVSVISFDGSELGRWMRPTLASVALPFFEMGQEAVRILLDPSDDESVVMEMPLLPGGSLAVLLRCDAPLDSAHSVTGVTSRRIVRHVPAGEGSTSTWQQ